MRGRVILVEDDPDILRLLRAYLDGVQPRPEVVGEAMDGLTAVTGAALLRPDLVLMDVMLPEMTGLEAARLIMERVPGVHVILFTGYAEAWIERLSRELGVFGFLRKGAEFLRLPEMVRRGLEAPRPQAAVPVPHPPGQGYVDPPGGGAPGLLSPAERRVLELMVRGYTYPTIARLLCIGQATVKTHAGHIYEKLGVHSRLDVVLRVGHGSS